MNIDIALFDNITDERIRLKQLTYGNETFDYSQRMSIKRKKLRRNLLMQVIKKNNLQIRKGKNMGEIVQAENNHLHELTKLAIDLWPDNNFQELKKEFAEILASKQNKVFLYTIEKQTIAFIHLSIRSDYVEGADSSPTGYIEGIYVLPEFRQQGISKQLFAQGRKWLQSRGCKQVGSDIELNNQVSYQFHKSIGFKEANRLIAFIQDL